MDVMRRRLSNQHRINPIIVDIPDTEEALRALKPFEFQNYVINALNGTHSLRRTGDMGIDGHWFFTRDPNSSETVGACGAQCRLIIFETAMRRANFSVGYVITFSFYRSRRL